MGLDNIPHTYPCKTQGTAVLVAGLAPDDDTIDCEATQAAKGCPWLRDFEGQDRGQPVGGMFGTHCWFRGKVGTYMLERLVEAGYASPGGTEGFYGDTDAVPNLSPEHCRELSDWMKAHIEVYAKLVDGDKDELDMYRYAAWWLGWVGENCGGSDAWW